LISVIFVVAVLGGFLACASVGVMYLKPACPKCGSRAAVAYKAVKGRSKKRGKTTYYCEACDRDFSLKKKEPMPLKGKLLLLGAVACLVVFGVNHIRHLLLQDRTMSSLRAEPDLSALIEKKEDDSAQRAPTYGDFRFAVYKRTTPRERVQQFLNLHAAAEQVGSDEESVTYAFRYGWFPSYKLTITFDDKGRYRAKGNAKWW